MERPPLPETLDTELLHGRSLADWHRWLVTDEVTGEDMSHLAAPCSRYGRNADECAWWAVAAEVIYVHAKGGDDEAEVALSYLMSLAVNDHGDLAELVDEYWYAVPDALKQQLGEHEEVKQLINEGGAA